MNIYHESEELVGKIREYIHAGISPNEIAVLYRTILSAEILVEKLMEYNIPFV